MTLTQVSAVLFDLDGTLADTAPDLVNALNLSLQDHGIQSQSETQLRSAASHGSMALVNAAIPDADEALRLAVQQGLLNHYQQVNGDHCQLFEGIASMLDWFDAVKLPYGVITNKPARFTRPLLKKLKLEQRLSVMISGDSTRFAKPHTAPMLLAAQQVQCLPQHILYLGDAERDLIAANAAGMLGGVALWGYLSESDKPDTWPHHAQFATPTRLHQALMNNVRRN
ncbi:HAD family hydrolase [Shewanella acanthi]|uniref:HAD family hydrolase n=1 Tax=Shewanella acanthi TaxID=2864212 RepID=UPI001C65D6C6|nr:HAD-IA family hydrolase [Shewanella acanthi]QYJ77340.1 HAD-IA family hydrolase [Shewanella acanthi]